MPLCSIATVAPLTAEPSLARETVPLIPPPAIVRLRPLLAIPDTVTTTFPVIAPEGTLVVMLFALQLVGLDVVPLNVAELLPIVDPKLEPLITIESPMPADVRERLVRLGDAVAALTL